MFGQVESRYCTKCEKEVQRRVSTIHFIEGKRYIKNFNCPECKEDLAKEDKSAITKAHFYGKQIVVKMC